VQIAAKMIATNRDRNSYDLMLK